MCGRHPPTKRPHRRSWAGRARALLAAACAAVGAAVAAPSALQPWPDAPDPQLARPGMATAPARYTDIAQQWRSAADIENWIGAHFSYDAARALQMSEAARAAQPQSPAVLAPEAFFAAPHGVCIDLARFAVSTLRQIDAGAQAAYLMIEFEPVLVQGQWLRRHWMASFRRDGAYWFFADSRRPGHIAGPYDTVEQFVADYAVYRQRPIVSYRLLPGHERAQRARAALR